jgi:hypothetical protein
VLQAHRFRLSGWPWRYRVDFYAVSRR